jgi:Na+/citrate or Na+/malate symporter
MEVLIVILIMLIISTILAIVWANAIITMYENHPDYIGDDWLNFKNKSDSTNTDDDKIKNKIES